jgi:HlyD family secretion protein/epimerase transport system membrane fusion protein
MTDIDLAMDAIEHDGNARPPRSDTRVIVYAGIAVVVLTFGGIGGWAALAEISSAAVGSGVVKIEGERRPVQHLEGGIVREVLVPDGASVTPNQVLVRLDTTKARALLELLTSQYRTLAASAARLTAERDGSKSIDFPPELMAQRHEPDVARLMAGETYNLQARRVAREGQVDITRKRIAQLKEEIGGHQAYIQSLEQQRALILDELTGLKTLFEKGYATKTRLLALERTAARLTGERADKAASIARANQAISELELRIVDLDNQFSREVLAELQGVNAKLVETDERMRAAADILIRTEITAPVGGVVVGLKVHTAGAVIAPGDKVLDIVPSGEVPIVEAQVRPDDIDVVTPGLPASVRLTAFNNRQIPPIHGTVRYVSADSFVDTRSGKTYFVARVELNREELRNLGVSVTPGMLAQVMIITGTRTPLQYITRPLFDGLDRAFREDGGHAQRAAR